jgi:hypothetical protein
MTDLGHGKRERFTKPVEVIGGLADTNVTTPVLIGDADNKVAKTINKRILGAINENTASMGTGLVYGGEISINADPTKVDFTDGGVKVVDSHTNSKKPVLVLIEWTGLTGVSVTNIGTQPFTFFGMNSAGVIDQNATGFSPENERDIATLGLGLHKDFATVTKVSNFGNWLRDMNLNLADLLSGLGGRLNLGGNEYFANGSNLRLNKRIGSTFGMGVNYANNKKDPNIKPDGLQEDITFNLIQRSVAPLDAQDVPNDKYDPTGTGTLADIPDGYFTVHRVFYDTSSEEHALQYGQFVYDSLKKASTSWREEKFILDPILTNSPLRSLIVIRKDCPALTDKDCVKFVQAGIFGSRTFEVIESFSRFAEPVEIIDGMTYQRQALSYVDDGGVLYVDVAAEFNFEADDISFVNADSSINTIAEDFTKANLQVGDKIIIFGSANNNDIFTVVTIATTKIVVSETITDEAAGDNITIETPGKGNITFVFGQREFVLDCTTGSGVGGRARIALTASTDVAPKENWVCVIRSGETAILQSSIAEPTGEYSMITTAFVPSVATTISGAFYNSRRHTDTKEIDGRGAIATILSKLRDPSSYKSGALANVTIDTGPSPDSVDLTITPGVFREIYNQKTRAMQLSLDGAIVVNDNTTPYKPISDFNEITEDANGDTLVNKYFQVIVFLSLNANGYPDRIVLGLPNGSYISAAAAFDDVSGYSDTTLPSGFTSAYLVCAVVLRNQGGSIITNAALGFGLNNIPLQGQELGVKSSGAGAAAITQFTTDLFRLLAALDNTKKLEFVLDNIGTGQTRKLTMPDRDVDLSAVSPGFADGFVVKYNNTTSVTITSGSILANGKFYTLPLSDVVHNMTSLASAFDFHYIYIDDSESTAPDAVFIDSTTEPAYSIAKRGWYNGDDRCIGTLTSTDGAATIDFFETVALSDNYIRNTALKYDLAQAMDPNGAWQTPNILECSARTPVNATELLLNMRGEDLPDQLGELAWRSSEGAAIVTQPFTSPFFIAGPNRIYMTFPWGALGASRNIKIFGGDNDNNAMYARVVGYGYSR